MPHAGRCAGWRLCPPLCVSTASNHANVCCRRCLNFRAAKVDHCSLVCERIYLFNTRGIIPSFFQNWSFYHLLSLFCEPPSSFPPVPFPPGRTWACSLVFLLVPDSSFHHVGEEMGPGEGLALALSGSWAEQLRIK